MQMMSLRQKSHFITAIYQERCDDDARWNSEGRKGFPDEVRSCKVPRDSDAGVLQQFTVTGTGYRTETDGSIRLIKWRFQWRNAISARLPNHSPVSISI